MSGYRRGAHDHGSATVWAAAGIAVIMTVFMVGLHLGSAVLARHRAEAAADLAALAAAGLAVEGVEAACRRADEVAGSMGATVTSCRLIDWDALVEVRVPVAVALPGIDIAAGRARAGPVPVTTPPERSPPRRVQGAAALGTGSPSSRPEQPEEAAKGDRRPIYV